MDWEDSLEKTKPSHFSILALRVPWTIQMGIPDNITSLLTNLYAGQEATVPTGHGTTNWFQIGKGVHQDCILSPCLFDFYTEYIMQNARLDEAQTVIRIAWLLYIIIHYIIYYYIIYILYYIIYIIYYYILIIIISITSDMQMTPPLW